MSGEGVVAPQFVWCDPPIAVRVLHDDGEWYDGLVTNFTGSRINVQFSTEPGSTYWYVVPPERVQLVEPGHDEAAPAAPGGGGAAGAADAVRSG